MKNLYDYVILFDEFEEKDGVRSFKDTVILQDKKTILAESDRKVLFRATREVPEQYVDQSDNVRIIIRPF